MGSYKTCPDCDSIAFGEIGGIRINEKGNGECKHCHGTGRDAIGEALVRAATFDTERGKIDCKYCYGTGICQTCQESGYVNDFDDDEEQNEPNRNPDSGKGFVFLLILAFVFVFFKEACDPDIRERERLEAYWEKLKIALSVPDTNALKKLSVKPLISIAGIADYSLSSFIQDTEIATFSFDKSYPKRIKNPNEWAQFDWIEFNPEEKVYEVRVYRRTNTQTAYDGAIVHSGKEVFIYIKKSGKKYKLFSFGGPVNVLE